jgi:CRISPR-associated protein Cas2
MTLLLVRRVPDRLRGRLTRWLLEVDAGVYAGPLNARLREHVWALVERERRGGYALMLWPDGRALQGFGHCSAGQHRIELVDRDGLAMPLRLAQVAPAEADA